MRRVFHSVDFSGFLPSAVCRPLVVALAQLHVRWRGNDSESLSARTLCGGLLGSNLPSAFEVRTGLDPTVLLACSVGRHHVVPNGAAFAASNPNNRRYLPS